MKRKEAKERAQMQEAAAAEARRYKADTDTGVRSDSKTINRAKSAASRRSYKQGELYKRKYDAVYKNRDKKTA